MDMLRIIHEKLDVLEVKMTEIIAASNDTPNDSLKIISTCFEKTRKALAREIDDAYELDPEIAKSMAEEKALQYDIAKAYERRLDELVSQGYDLLREAADIGENDGLTHSEKRGALKWLCERGKTAMLRLRHKNIMAILHDDSIPF
jgi:hypothetical protein